MKILKICTVYCIDQSQYQAANLLLIQLKLILKNEEITHHPLLQKFTEPKLLSENL